MPKSRAHTTAAPFWPAWVWTYHSHQIMYETYEFWINHRNIWVISKIEYKESPVRWLVWCPGRPPLHNSTITHGHDNSRGNIYFMTWKEWTSKNIFSHWIPILYTTGTFLPGSVRPVDPGRVQYMQMRFFLLVIQNSTKKSEYTFTLGLKFSLQNELFWLSAETPLAYKTQAPLWVRVLEWLGPP